MAAWESSEGAEVTGKRDRCESRGKSSLEPPEKLKKVEEVPAPQPIAELFGKKKAKAKGELVRALQTALERILVRRDPGKITEAELEQVADCLEEVIIRDVSVQALVESKVGMLIKQFYELVHAEPRLKAYDLISRCAFRKLKKRACEMLFGITPRCCEPSPVLVQAAKREEPIRPHVPSPVPVRSSIKRSLAPKHLPTPKPQPQPEAKEKAPSKPKPKSKSKSKSNHKSGEKKRSEYHVPILRSPPKDSKEEQKSSLPQPPVPLPPEDEDGPEAEDSGSYRGAACGDAAGKPSGSSRARRGADASGSPE